ncbi:MAG: hypothetical protein B7Z18_04380 [Alishewanella sp. 32-51-5]|nr:MAG: hypothetical protein B7Z18_04380 [Alishewanella sp. 32-51-5]
MGDLFDYFNRQTACVGNQHRHVLLCLAELVLQRNQRFGFDRAACVGGLDAFHTIHPVFLVHDTQCGAQRLQYGLAEDDHLVELHGD